jgi:hypothetical protein
MESIRCACRCSPYLLFSSQWPVRHAQAGRKYGELPHPIEKSGRKVVRPQENHHRRIDPIQGETIPAARYLVGDGAATVMP